MMSKRANLIPFDQTEDTSSFEVEAVIEQDDTSLLLSYSLVGDISSLVIPKSVSQPKRTEGLYRHTCFEMFLLDSSGKYLEWNFSPSGDWCIFNFDKYRTRSSHTFATEASFRIYKTSMSADSLSLKVNLHLNEIKLKATRLGVFAVLEHANKKLSYWALGHGKEKADFHDAKFYAISL